MISFIIPAHNEEQLVGRTLDALISAAAAIGREYEIIVVADACNDRTAEVAASRDVRVIEVEHRQIAATRNSGARAARGDVFFFIDADTLANAEALRAALAAIEQGAIGGGFVFRFDGQVPLWGKLMHPLGDVAGRWLKLVGGCFLYCTRAGFEAVGGFCEDYYAAEELIFLRSLRRHGRLVVPRETVVTSGRKVRSFSPLEVLYQLLRVIVGGRRFLRRRDGLDVWYGPRRPDPETSAT